MLYLYIMYVELYKKLLLVSYYSRSLRTKYKLENCA